MGVLWGGWKVVCGRPFSVGVEEKEDCGGMENCMRAYV